MCHTLGESENERTHDFSPSRQKEAKKPSRTVKMRNLLNIFLQGRENVDVIAETQHDKCFS